MAHVQRGRVKLKELLTDCCSVELGKAGGVVDYEPKNGAGCDGCDCDCG